MPDALAQCRRVWVLNYCLRAAARTLLRDLETGALSELLANAMGATEWIQIEAVLAELGPDSDIHLDLDGPVAQWHQAMPETELSSWGARDTMIHARREAISIWWSLDGLMDPRLHAHWAKTEARLWLDRACEYIQWADGESGTEAWAALWLSLAPSLMNSGASGPVLRNPVMTVDLLTEDDES